MTQTDSLALQTVLPTGTPYHCVLERLLQCPMYLVAYIFDRRVIADDERLAEIGIFPFSAGASAQYRGNLKRCLTYRLVYIRINCSSSQHLSTTS